MFQTAGSLGYTLLKHSGLIAALDRRQHGAREQNDALASFEVGKPSSEIDLLT
jgi:hypothetical protein